MQIPKLPFLCSSGVVIANNLSFSAPAIVCHHVGIPGSPVSFLHCFYVLVEADPLPGFSSRGDQKPVGGRKGPSKILALNFSVPTAFPYLKTVPSTLV